MGADGVDVVVDDVDRVPLEAVVDCGGGALLGAGDGGGGVE